MTYELGSISITIPIITIAVIWLECACIINELDFVFALGIFRIGIMILGYGKGGGGQKTAKLVYINIHFEKSSSFTRRTNIQARMRMTNTPSWQIDRQLIDLTAFSITSILNSTNNVAVFNYFVRKHLNRHDG